MKRIIHILLAVMPLLTCCQCKKEEPKQIEYDRVAVLFSLGRNSLNYYLSNDIGELCRESEGAYVPEYGSGNALLVVSHSLTDDWDYDELTESVLFSIHKNKAGEVVRDTLFSLPPEAALTEPANLRMMFDAIKEKFPSQHYGMIYSSHGSGWLPDNYFGTGKFEPKVRPFGETQSIGQEIQGSEQIFMDLPDFAASFPYHFDYILLDACLMGNIETVYELRNCADQIAVSATEIMADGFDYKNLARRLLTGTSASPKAVCEDYIAQYNAKTGYESSACIALVNTAGLDNLAAVCKELFVKYGPVLETIDQSKIQRFFRYDPEDESDLLQFGWFYDLEDAVRKAGASQDEMDRLSKAINGCIAYKACTKEFMANINGFTFDNYCGLGMALPQFKDEQLKEYYKTLAWNKATALVK